MEHLDVLIVGAGLSGIGAAYHLQTSCPGKTYAILEGRDTLGGTWDLFRYPGIRSDSDMYTLGYSFRPWSNPKAIADGPSILAYIRDTAEAFGIDRAIRYDQRVVSACWSTEDARWTVRTSSASGDTTTLTCGFLFTCAGYYRYDRGYTPDFEGVERFEGRVVHPQHWTEDIAYAGKRVVVIGSGATAVTLAPELSKTAAHVTMLQRSPTYMYRGPSVDPLANWLRKRLPARPAYAITRWKNVLLSIASYQFARRQPEKARAWLVDNVRKALTPGYDVETHFSPHYDPWDQRLCLVPDDDLFEAINAGRMSVVTDHIETFTEGGLRLRSGQTLDADLVVTATGLDLLFLGGMALEVDGQPVDLASRLTYKGLMLSGVPNLAIAVGYINASWTLKCDLTCAYVCRLLNHMDRHGYTRCTPQRDPSEPGEPLLGFDAGYVLRSVARFPKQGQRPPWKAYQNYLLDLWALRLQRLTDRAMEFGR